MPEVVSWPTDWLCDPCQVAWKGKSNDCWLCGGEGRKERPIVTSQNGQLVTRPLWARRSD